MSQSCLVNEQQLKESPLTKGLKFTGVIDECAFSKSGKNFVKRMRCLEDHDSWKTLEDRNRLFSLCETKI